MSDETYYTILGVKETASASEIKTAYRDLIKQVHPDTIASLAPYLRKIAEDKAKEITEAYTVLSNASKRGDYDRQLAAYRHHNAPQAAPPAQPTHPPTSSAKSFGYCNKCGTSLYASGYCPKCGKFATSAATPPQPKVVRWLGYNWAPLMRWSREHPMLILVTSVFLVFVIASVMSDDTATRDASDCPPSQRVQVNGRFVCQAPAPATQAALASTIVAPVKAAHPVVSQTASPTPAVSISGTYLGTVHNQTANLSSTFMVVIHQAKDRVLSGCMEVKPPLYGSGTLRGSFRGSQADFVVADIAFQGNASKNEIAGSYVVTRQEGNQLGEFHLMKQTGEPSYHCHNGVVTTIPETATSPSSQQFSDLPAGSTVLPPSAKLRPSLRAIVIGGYSSATLYKRCAFLPSDNYGRCDYGPEEVAELKQGDQVTVLSPLTRAENGEDIYKVRTAQGWVGWINAASITLEAQSQ